MKEKIDKSILNRIKKIEKAFPTTDLVTREDAETIIDSIEKVLQNNLRSKIQLLDKDYFDMDKLYKHIFSFLTIEELRKIAYYNDDKKYL